MRILAIGDIFGKVGRNILFDFLHKIRKKYSIDIVIANVENVTHGKSISKKHFHFIKESGVDIMTSGNHIFSLEETKSYISNFPELLRPLNSNPFHPGNGSFLTVVRGKKIRVTNIIGNAFMPHSQNPYYELEKIIEKKDYDIHIVDFHAESTAEKAVLAWYFDGEISFLYGTHTHVQTADERILAKGTAFITDIGMTGPKCGIIGANPISIIKRAKFGFSSKMEPNDDSGQFNAVLIEFDNKDNSVSFIERFNMTRDTLEKTFS